MSNDNEQPPAQMPENSREQDCTRSGKSISIHELRIVEYLYVDGVAKPSYFSLPIGVASKISGESNFAA